MANAALNFESRSWSRNRSGLRRSSRSMNRLRACWTIHRPVGRLVHPLAYTYNVFDQTISLTGPTGGTAQAASPSAPSVRTSV
jgi:hypothetical protein